MPDRATRRDFFRQSALAGAAGSAMLAARPARAQSPNEKVRFACIGVGGKGQSDTDDAGKNGEIVALCDVDEKTLDKMAAKYPNAKKYHDYRKMLEEMGEKIDAVTVSTPDHTHAIAAAMAMRMGKHAFVQKPLTWSIEEARLLRTLAAEKKLATQMGNQGTAADGFRRGVEVIRSGALGSVKEIHVWTNRPIWPPYNAGYHPFAWRGWLDFGTGALGDMACHTVNVAAMALNLFDPETVEVVETAGIVDKETYPAWSIIKTHFGEREGRGPVDLIWYDGGEKLPAEKRSEIKAKLKAENLPKSGLLLVGDRGTFFSPDDYGARHSLMTSDGGKMELPVIEQILPRSPGHFREWVDAITAKDPSKALSNFDYAGRLTETVLLGVVALKAGGRIEWDAAGMRARNNSDADQYLRRDYRNGFSIHTS